MCCQRPSAVLEMEVTQCYAIMAVVRIINICLLIPWMLTTDMKHPGSDLVIERDKEQLSESVPVCTKGEGPTLNDALR